MKDCFYITFLAFGFLTISCVEKEIKDWKTEIPTFEYFETKGLCDTSFRSTNPNFENSNINSEQKPEIRKQFKLITHYFNCNYKVASIQTTKEEWESHIFNAYNGKFIKTIKHKYGAEFSKESSLIIFDGMDDGTFDQLTQYWIIENGKMKRIK